jgi:hypothetical protein
MKRNTLAVAAIAFAATATTIGTAVASFVPALAPVAVSVRKDEVPTGAPVLLSAGTQNLTTTPTGGNGVTVQIDDERTPAAIDTRKGRYSNDTEIRVSTAAVVITQAQSGVVIEN